MIIVSRIIHVKLDRRLNVTNKFKYQRRLSSHLPIVMFRGTPCTSNPNNDIQFPFKKQFYEQFLLWHFLIWGRLLKLTETPIFDLNVLFSEMLPNIIAISNVTKNSSKNEFFYGIILLEVVLFRWMEHRSQRKSTYLG